VKNGFVTLNLEKIKVEQGKFFAEPAFCIAGHLLCHSLVLVRVNGQCRINMQEILCSFIIDYLQEMTYKSATQQQFPKELLHEHKKILLNLNQLIPLL